MRSFCASSCARSWVRSRKIFRKPRRWSASGSMTPLPQKVEPSLRRCQRSFAARPFERASAISRAGAAVLGGKEDVARAADHVGLMVAEDALGAGVPGRDPAVRVEGEDRVFLGALEDQAEPLLRVAVRPLRRAAFNDRLAQLTRDLVDLAKAG